MRMLTPYQCIVQPAPVGARGCLRPGTRPFAEFWCCSRRKTVRAKTHSLSLFWTAYVQKLALLADAGAACAPKQFLQKLTLYHCFGSPTSRNSPLLPNSGTACAPKQFLQKLTLYHCFGFARRETSSRPAGKLPQRMSALEALAKSRRGRSERKDPKSKNANSRNQSADPRQFAIFNLHFSICNSLCNLGVHPLSETRR